MGAFDGYRGQATGPEAMAFLVGGVRDTESLRFDFIHRGLGLLSTRETAEWTDSLKNRHWKFEFSTVILKLFLMEIFEVLL